MRKISLNLSAEKLWEQFNNDFDSFYNLKTLGKMIEGDLDKVSFDFENYEYSHLDEVPGEIGGWLGYRYTWFTGSGSAGRFPIIGCWGGGDWEYPVNFIIYKDNKERWRGYIPKDGNTWNHKTKEAFGNDEEEDQKFLRKWLTKRGQDATMLTGDVSDAAVMLDYKKMLNEIRLRFEA